jgi:hypothetical protein
MGCCGSAGSAFTSLAATRQARARLAQTPIAKSPTAGSRVFFEYIGPTAMTVIGRASGRRYTFERPGARVAIDPIDQPSLSSVPNLRAVGGAQ